MSEESGKNFAGHAIPTREWPHFYPLGAPKYSISEGVAIFWIRKKKCRTRMVRLLVQANWQGAPSHGSVQSSCKIQAPGALPSVSASYLAACLRNAGLSTGRLNPKKKLRLAHEAAY